MKSPSTTGEEKEEFFAEAERKGRGRGRREEREEREKSLLKDHSALARILIMVGSNDTPTCSCSYYGGLLTNRLNNKGRGRSQAGVAATFASGSTNTPTISKSFAGSPKSLCDLARSPLNFQKEPRLLSWAS